MIEGGGGALLEYASQEVGWGTERQRATDGYTEANIAKPYIISTGFGWGGTTPVFTNKFVYPTAF